MATMNCILLESCRLCQQETGVISIEDNHSLVEKIFSITKIQVRSDHYEFMPKSICTSCCKVLDDVEIYTKKVQHVDEGLNLYASKLLREGTVVKDSINLKVNLKAKWKCEDRPVSFNNDLIFQKHLISHKVIKSFACPVCQKLYKREKNYNLHKKSHSELFCSKCCTTFNSALQRDVHTCGPMDLVLNKTCEIKSGHFEQKNYKDDSPNFLCEVCNKEFDDKSSLLKHLKQHQYKSDYVCSKDGCTKAFPALYLLKSHELIHEGKKPFLCVTCGKEFRTKNSLACHEKIHLGIKNYHCEWCDLSFSVRSNLRAHLRAYHEGVRYYCSQCTKAFVTKCALDRHEKTHIGIRDFKCQDCSSEFYTKKELKKHQRYHQGLKPFQCEQCFKTFFENHHLTIHLRIHSGERPYVCNINQCGKSFIDKQKLKRHEKSKHKLVQNSTNGESGMTISQHCVS